MKDLPSSPTSSVKWLGHRNFEYACPPFLLRRAVKLNQAALALAFALLSFAVSAQNITTVAGNGDRGYSGEGGPATAATLNLPQGVVADQLGNIYIADSGNHVIRKVDKNGTIAAFAGIPGMRGYSGDGGQARLALLDTPRSIAMDGIGNIYFVTACVVRKIASTGVITTVAGNGFGIPPPAQIHLTTMASLLRA